MARRCCNRFEKNKNKEGNMPETIVKTKGWKCLRCGNEWVPKKFDQKKRPKTCPKCRSVYWDTPKK